MSKKHSDELGADTSIDYAIAHADKRIGLAVDDLIKVDAMLVRVERIAKRRGVAYAIERINGGVVVRIEGRGEIFIFAADVLTGRPGD